jgi:hypothetical protein
VSESIWTRFRRLLVGTPPEPQPPPKWPTPPLFPEFPMQPDRIDPATGEWGPGGRPS